MTVATPAPAKPGLRRPALDHATAMRLAATEYDRFIGHLRQIPADAWSSPTACPDWDVHAMACHVLGMAEMNASMRENVRQLRTATRAAKRNNGVFIDALTELQVAEHSGLSPRAVIDAFSSVAPKAARGRRRVPALMRRLPIGEQPIGDSHGETERWSLGFLNDVILTRDPWMHRSDIAIATGVELELTPDHDGVLVADVAAEWAARHGEHCTLVLSGPAGGSWTWGSGGPTLESDAVEFCRVISGRGPADGLLATRVPF
jgi:uncharacterized protein (TIGR03083 family)